MKKFILNLTVCLILIAIVYLVSSLFSSTEPNPNREQPSQGLDHAKIEASISVFTPKATSINQAPQATNKTTTEGTQIIQCNDPAFDVYQHLASKESEYAALFDNAYFTQLLDENAVSLETKITQLLYLAAMSKDQTHLQPLIALFNEFPSNNLLAHNVLIACQHGGCEQQVIEQALHVNQHNGASWIAYASLINNQNDPSKTIEALTNAANAATYDEYWSEKFLLVEETFYQLGLDDEVIPIFAEVIAGSFRLPTFSIINENCQKADQDNIALLDTCISLGKKLEQSDSTVISKLIGIVVQETAYKTLHDESELALLDKRTAPLKAQTKERGKASQLLFRNKQLTKEYFYVLRTGGEVNASKWAVKKAKQLSSDKNFDPCQINW